MSSILIPLSPCPPFFAITFPALTKLANGLVITKIYLSITGQLPCKGVFANGKLIYKGFCPIPNREKNSSCLEIYANR